MDNYLLLKIAHSLPGLLLLLGLLAHIFMLWKANRGGDAAVLQRKLRRIRLISLPLRDASTSRHESPAPAISAYSSPGS